MDRNINMIGAIIQQQHLPLKLSHVKNLGVFANLGYKINDYYTLSLHGRNDDHKETGGNQTYR